MSIHQIYFRDQYPSSIKNRYFCVGKLLQRSRQRCKIVNWIKYVKTNLGFFLFFLFVSLRNAEHIGPIFSTLYLSINFLQLFDMYSPVSKYEDPRNETFLSWKYKIDKQWNCWFIVYEIKFLFSLSSSNRLIEDVILYSENIPSFWIYKF